MGNLAAVSDCMVVSGASPSQVPRAFLEGAILKFLDLAEDGLAK